MVGVSMNMNEVDYLISNRFSLMSLEEKLEVKRLGTHQPNYVQIYCQECGQNMAGNSAFVSGSTTFRIETLIKLLTKHDVTSV